MRDAQVKRTQNSKKATTRRISILINATEKQSSRDRQMRSRGVWSWGMRSVEGRSNPNTLKPNPNLEQGNTFKTHNHDDNEELYFSTSNNAKCIKMHRKC